MNGNLDPLLALSDDLAILDGIAHRWRLCYLAQPEGNKIGVREVSALDRAIDALRNTRPANARADGETQRLDFMLLHGFTVKRMVDTGGYMLLHEEYPFDGGEFETPREAIDAALLDFQSPPAPVSEAKS